MTVDSYKVNDGDWLDHYWMMVDTGWIIIVDDDGYRMV